MERTYLTLNPYIRLENDPKRVEKLVFFIFQFFLSTYEVFTMEKFSKCNFEHTIAALWKTKRTVFIKLRYHVRVTFYRSRNVVVVFHAISWLRFVKINIFLLFVRFNMFPKSKPYLWRDWFSRESSNINIPFNQSRRRRQIDYLLCNDRTHWNLNWKRSMANLYYSRLRKLRT